jgi:excisionase family DNA binding protein
VSSVARALLAELGPEELAELAERLRPYLPAQDGAAEDGWLDTKAAAAYLGISTHALHRLTAERRVPFAQDRPGARCYFRPSDLDAWRESGARRLR